MVFQFKQISIIRFTVYVMLYLMKAMSLVTVDKVELFYLTASWRTVGPIVACPVVHHFSFAGHAEMTYRCRNSTRRLVHFCGADVMLLRRAEHS